MNKLQNRLRQFTIIYATARHKFSIEEQVHFAQRLSFLISAGTPLITSIDIMRNDVKDKYKKKVYLTIFNDITHGQYLSQSLWHCKGGFSKFFTNIVYIGEMSGTLSKNLEFLSAELKKKYVLRRKIKNALFYPVFISVTTVVLTGTLIFYIFPKILPVFKSMNVELPLSTKIVIFVSDLLSSNPLLLSLGFGVCAISMIMLIKFSRKTQLFIEKVLLKLPVSKKIVIQYNLAHFTRTLGLLLQSNIPISRALSITAETTSNSIYRNACVCVEGEVTKGATLSRSLAPYQALFPQLAISMVSVGETTGRLGDTCIYLSQLYEDEVESFTKNLSSFVEPFLMLFMGCVIGFVALSIITPVYEVTQNLQ